MKLITWASWLAGLLGFGLLIAGIALIHVPAAFIVAGIGLLGWAYIADRAAATMSRKPSPGGG
ncbi:hypothetical protein [Pseudomonas shahriarae]|uniref:hypothetical protein n=1 Tax=Pseudomonas shahriarae TaxID=2745512 RepID=UPI00235E6D49|nr:hypothetical protein [Pseudomonas shahriarae]MDD0981313.1 hypothetical protein [Pseudomonas shahriarae]